jgi:HEAT repeat protein
MPALMARFPGPVQFERARIATMPNPPRASECGVILRLVAHERKVALPFVLEHLVDPDAEKRGWATHLLIELPYIEALPRLLERLRDEDPATRASAGHAVAAVARSHSGRVAQSLRDLASDGDVRERTAALRAMGIVRDASLVPTLIHGLGDGNEDAIAAAHAALVQVTRQDFGADARLWLKWWEQNGSRHRLEWLIDALTHEVAEVRRAAGEELRALSRQYFGYASDLPPRDRERAQQRYRDWWITEGRTRYRRA